MCLWAQSQCFSLSTFLTASLGGTLPLYAQPFCGTALLLWRCSMDNVVLSRRGYSLSPAPWIPWMRSHSLNTSFPFFGNSFLYPSFTHITPFVLVLLSHKDIQCLDPCFTPIHQPISVVTFSVFSKEQVLYHLNHFFGGPISQTPLLSWSAISALKALNKLCNCVSVLWVWIQLLPLTNRVTCIVLGLLNTDW